MTKAQIVKIYIAAGQAVQAVQKAKNKKSVFKSVAAFQKLDGMLKSDGQWGNNTSTAAAWYLQHDVPPSAFPNGNITWQPPDVSENASDPSIAKKLAAIKGRNATSPFTSTKGVSASKVRNIVTKDAPAYGQPSVLSQNNTDVESNIANYLSSTVNPKIDNIQKILSTQQLSTQATQEHRKIVRSDDFQKQVLDLLLAIKAKIDSQKIALDRRTLATIVI